MSMSLVMKSVRTNGVDAVEVVEIPRPAPGPRDAVVRVRACGICGTDITFLHLGGFPQDGRPGGAPRPVHLGHEPVGEIVDYGAEVRGLAVGDRVVVNPCSAPTGIIGCGGELGGMTEYLLVEDAVVGESLAVFPDSVPFEVASLSEPLAIARYCVERAEAAPTDQVAVLGTGPVGLGATIWLKLRGVRHVVVVGTSPERLQKALAVGADAVIDCATEDLTARLTELHGRGADRFGQPRPATDVYIDTSGTAAAFDTVVANARRHARFALAAARQPAEEFDLGGMLRSELTFIASQGHRTEMFEVTPELTRHQNLFAKIISHRVPYAEVEKAFELASAADAAEKVVVTLP